MQDIRSTNTAQESDIPIYDIISRGFLHLNPAQAIRTGLVQEENNELSGLKTIIIKTPSEYNRTDRNWGGQILFEYAQVKFPKTKEELQDAVVSAPGTVRVVGRGHSFSPVCQVKEGTLINLIQFSDILNFKPPTEG